MKVEVDKHYHKTQTRWPKKVSDIDISKEDTIKKYKTVFKKHLKTFKMSLRGESSEVLTKLEGINYHMGLLHQL